MFLIFDTETTGLPKDWNAPVENIDNWPRLVQLAWLLYDKKENKIAQGNRIIKPEGFTIPEESARVHGINTERALKEGISLINALEEFEEDMARADFLVAHNMNFDEKIVGAEFLRNNIKNDFFQKKRICTMISSIDFCQIPGSNSGGYKWPRLSELHIKLFGKDFEDAHDAFVDTSACARCFFELKKNKIIDLPEDGGTVQSFVQGSLF